MRDRGERRKDMFRKATLVVLALFVFAGFSTAAEDGPKAKGKDFGREPWVVDIEDATVKNKNFRTALWTGQNLQMTVMSIKPGGEIGLEKHDSGDQFIRVEKGHARVVMGESRDKMTFDKTVSDDWAIFIPAGFWHNIINTGKNSLKVYVIYAPPEHAAGAIHKTFEESEADHDR
ncbi:MAG: cupin domain-containing protein [Deltaproteobacteria bacterium]|nr:cupin domain-containing protein [Syntrophaceae bacterium]NLX52932.1 cupin domain-containing protein [Deltaproteobacteria bacterium]